MDRALSRIGKRPDQPDRRWGGNSWDRVLGFVATPDVGAAIGPNDPEYRKQLSEKVKSGWTPERRADWAAKMAERQTLEERARRSAHQNAPDILARQREKQKDIWTPERRAARAAQVRAQMTPERVTAHKEKLRKTMSDPEWKARHSVAQRSKWTPEMRAAQSERTKAQFAVKRAALESGAK